MDEALQAAVERWRMHMKAMRDRVPGASPYYCTDSCDDEIHDAAELADAYVRLIDQETAEMKRDMDQEATP